MIYVFYAVQEIKKIVAFSISFHRESWPCPWAAQHLISKPQLKTQIILMDRHLTKITKE